jgi:hypothetical protein
VGVEARGGIGSNVGVGSGGGGGTGLDAGDRVGIVTAAGSGCAVAELDANLRPQVVSP